MFNEIVEDRTSVRFEAHGRAYDIDVVKESTLTRMGGHGWKEFIRQNHVIGEDRMIVFSLGGQTPRISIVYFSGGEKDSYDSTIISKVCHLSEDEHVHLLDIIPSDNTIVGVPFVTRLTNNNLAKHNMVCSKFFSFFMFVHNLWYLSHVITLFYFSSVVTLQKLPKKMVSSLHIPDKGMIGVCVGDFEVRDIAYEIDTDGRLIFNKAGWREFHRDEDDLQVGQALLITARTIKRTGLNIMFIIDII
jgi:hypothetical protein